MFNEKVSEKALREKQKNVFTGESSNRNLFR